MPRIRRATAADAALITHHRHSMFADNSFGTDAALRAMNEAFQPWLRTHLADETYVGLLLEEAGEVAAGAGIFFQDFPPHWKDAQPMRAYLLNFYTAPQARGRGHANLLLRAAIEECRSRDVGVVTLHASPFGKPIYRKFGFDESNEMLLQLRG